jgi:hypothetical protein
VYTVGVLGRLYTDVYEEVERGPVGALEAAGAGRLAVWAFPVVPQVAPRVLAFTLYRFEVNVRMTAMIGFVGAGGIGDRLHTAINLFHVTDLVALLGVLIAVVTAIDVVGDRLRYRILVARLGGFTHVQARVMAGAIPLCMRDIDREFKTVFIASRGSGITSPADLKGKTFAFGSKSSTSGHLMPRHIQGATKFVPAQPSDYDSNEQVARKVGLLKL